MNTNKIQIPAIFRSRAFESQNFNIYLDANTFYNV